MWYHFAFVAISVTLFGMTVGALLVYLMPGYFTAQRTERHLALASIWFAITIVLSFLTHLSIPFVAERSLVSVYSIFLNYAVLSIPFICSGIAVCLALTRFPRQVSKLYAADLAGAGLGCVLLIYVMRITDGPTAVFGVALLAAVGAWCFARPREDRGIRRTAMLVSVVLLLFVVGHTVLVRAQYPIVRLMWVKGARELRPLYEKWNSFSRVRVDGNPRDLEPPFGWGLSSTYPPERKIAQLHLNIDATAGTVLTNFNGDFSTVEHLRYDVTNIAHYVRPNSRVLVVGTGGGRDVLSALAFNQKEVIGVEINEDIIGAANRRFGDFTGHLDRDPRVRFVRDEARSYVARMREQVDILQVSLIDTWAATASGAFVLTENSLYTTEAWKIFLNHLSPAGVLTFSRWYFKERPGEVYRLATLAVQTLKECGIQDPRSHFVIVRGLRAHRPNAPDGIGTILVSKQPFSSADLDTLSAVCERMNFEVVQSPRESADAMYARIAGGGDISDLIAGYPLDISAPTDESPFFFHMLRLKDVFQRSLWSAAGEMAFNLKAVAVLAVLLVTVIVLTLLCIIIPLWLTTRRATLKGTLPLFLFFVSIGFGFMLVEISQMQRLIVFLGHPTYGLSVVLFSLLLASGIGSFTTDRISSSKGAMVRLSLLLIALAIFGMATPAAIQAFQAESTAVRIAVSVAILFPLGFFMGMAFPLGMKAAAGFSPEVTPWLWGINGATSVCASVLAVVIALSFSITTSFWLGFVCYTGAVISLVWASRRVVKLGVV